MNKKKLNPRADTTMKIYLKKESTTINNKEYLCSKEMGSLIRLPLQMSFNKFGEQ